MKDRTDIPAIPLWAIEIAKCESRLHVANKAVEAAKNEYRLACEALNVANEGSQKFLSQMRRNAALHIGGRINELGYYEE